MIDTE